ncbi:hypothetical protein J0H58_09910 [bacterium]|nr:hypothetical protein [bacterium]
MADQKNRGGQKAGDQDPAQPDRHPGTTTSAAERADADKQQDQRTNPDDATRTPTDQQR